MLDPIYVINLDASVDRFAKFQERNSHLDGVLQFSGVDGRLVNRQKLIADGIITNDLPYSAGSLGCSLSHISLWQKSITENRDITIFEDDGICVRRFREKAQAVVTKIKGHWDIIIWGYDYTPKFVWVDFGFSKAKLEFYDRRWADGESEFQAANFSSIPIKLTHSFGLFGYSVSPKGARMLLEYCLPLRKRVIPFPGTGVVINDICVDCTMCGVYPSMEAFACFPPLVLHDFKQASDRLARN